jgi:hypothetical protein
MKTTSTLAAAASLVALLVLPVRLEIAGTILLAASLAVLMHHDYRARRTLALPARRATRGVRGGRAIFRAPALIPEAHRLAA